MTGIGSGDVAVAKAGNVYTVNFQGALSANTTALTSDGADVSLVSGLTVPLGGGVDTEVTGFTNAQTLGAVLSAVLTEVNGSPVTVTPVYDSVAHTLSYDINWTHTVTGVDLPLDLGLDLGDLQDVVSNSLLTVTGSADFDLTFGIDLAARAAFTLAPPLPLSSGSGIEVPVDGVLDEDLIFDLVLNNDFDNPVPVTVTAASTSTNVSVADLILDFQAAVDAAILSGAAKALGFDYFNAGDSLAQLLTAARAPTSFAPTEGLVEIDGVEGVLFGLSVNQETPVTVFLPRVFTDGTPHSSS